MPKAYSVDLRERVVGFVEAGHSRRAAAAHFAVSVSFVVNLMKAWRTRLAADLAAATGVEADPATLSRWLIRNGYRFKKNAAGQRTRPARR